MSSLIMFSYVSLTRVSCILEGLDCHPLSNNQVEMQLLTLETELYPSNTDWGRG